MKLLRAQPARVGGPSICAASGRVMAGALVASACSGLGPVPHRSSAIGRVSSVRPEKNSESPAKRASRARPGGLLYVLHLLSRLHVRDVLQSRPLALAEGAVRRNHTRQGPQPRHPVVDLYRL